MATVTVLTAERMLEIEAISVVGGNINGSGHLILTKHDGSTIDAGNVAGPTGPAGPSGGITSVQMGFAGTLLVVAGKIRWYAPKAHTISNVIISVGTAPVGADIIVDVNKNGTTIFTTQANRPKITAGNFTDTSSVPDVTSLALNDYVTVDIDQIGSTTPGADLSVQIVVS